MSSSVVTKRAFQGLVTNTLSKNTWKQKVLFYNVNSYERTIKEHGKMDLGCIQTVQVHVVLN